MVMVMVRVKVRVRVRVKVKVMVMVRVMVRVRVKELVGLIDVGTNQWMIEHGSESVEEEGAILVVLRGVAHSSLGSGLRSVRVGVRSKRLRVMRSGSASPPP